MSPGGYWESWASFSSALALRARRATPCAKQPDPFDYRHDIVTSWLSLPRCLPARTSHEKAIRTQERSWASGSWARPNTFHRCWCRVWIVRGWVAYNARKRCPMRARNAGTLENDARDSQYPPGDNKDLRGFSERISEISKEILKNTRILCPMLVNWSTQPRIWAHEWVRCGVHRQ